MRIATLVAAEDVPCEGYRAGTKATATRDIVKSTGLKTRRYI
jgi:hypothetical protein